MNDPHVAQLRYRLHVGPNVSYKPGTTIKWSTTEFDGELTDGVLTLKMKTHHSTIGSAQRGVQGYLRAWEIKAGLDLGLGYLDFEFDSHEVIDRKPAPPGNPRVIEAGAGMFLCIGGTMTAHVTKAAYPSPPTAFALSPIVTTLWQRYRDFLERKEPLTSMGYFCLSVLQADALGRKQASAKYQIQLDVLNKLGQLTSEVGDEKTARKLDAGSTFRAHTAAEENWIRETVKQLIRRAGELSANPSGAAVMIQMTDLPTI